MAWRQIGAKPLSEPKLTRFTDTYIYIYIYTALGGDEFRHMDHICIMHIKIQPFNSLWPSDAIWQPRSGTRLTHVIWLVAWWHKTISCISLDLSSVWLCGIQITQLLCEGINSENEFEKYTYKFTFRSLWGQTVLQRRWEVRNPLISMLWQVPLLTPGGYHSQGHSQNGRHFSDDIFICIFLNENVWISIKYSLKFVPKVRINNIPALVQIMAWRWPGDKPLSEPMMVRFPAHICITWPQWVNMVFNLVWKIPPLTLKQLGYVFRNIISFSNIVPSKCNISVWTAPIQWMFNQHSGYWWPGFSPRASVAIVMGTHPWVCSTWYIPNLWVKSLRPCGAYMHR